MIARLMSLVWGLPKEKRGYVRRTKVCSSCGQEKSIMQYYRGKPRAEGTKTWCKECHKRWMRAYWSGAYAS